MGRPLVHFEIIGKNPARLRSFYAELFGCDYDTSGRVSDAVSEPDDYGFVSPDPAIEGPGVPGGIGGGASYDPHVIFYIGVDDVAATLDRAESLGGTTRLTAQPAPGRPLVIGQFTDPEGNLIGVASA
jgi:predicted enzyme related to lactoylglutathione lyase